MGSEADQSLLVLSHEEEDCEPDNLRQDIGIRNRVEQAVFNMKQQKSVVILKSALQNITSNTKFMFLMILSTVPLLVIMVVYECNIQKLVGVISELVVQPSHTYYYDFDLDNFIFHDESDESRKRFRSFVQLVPFYMVLSPLIELFSLTVVTNIAAKTYTGDQIDASLRETFCEVFYRKFKLEGPLITSFLVQLLSNSTIVGLFWTLANYYIITSGFYFEYQYFPRNSYMDMLLIVFHAMFFMALLYKFLDWSAMWNMSIVISVLEDESGIDALEISGYCRKHSRQTGFQLMLFCFVYGVFVRLPLLLGGMFSMNAEVAVTAIVVVLFCLGNLVKWVALVLYYYECKAQIFLKKVDEEVGKSEKAGDV